MSGCLVTNGPCHFVIYDHIWLKWLNISELLEDLNAEIRLREERKVEWKSLQCVDTIAFQGITTSLFCAQTHFPSSGAMGKG